MCCSSLRILRKIADGESVNHYETVRVKADGDTVDISLSVSPIKDAAGKIVGASAIARDITERRRRDERLKDLAAMLDKAQDAILIVDMQQQVTYWNHRAERLYGWPVDEALGKNVRDLLYSEDTSDFDRAMAQVWLRLSHLGDVL